MNGMKKPAINKRVISLTATVFEAETQRQTRGVYTSKRFVNTIIDIDEHLLYTVFASDALTRTTCLLTQMEKAKMKALYLALLLLSSELHAAELRILINCDECDIWEGEHDNWKLGQDAHLTCTVNLESRDGKFYRGRSFTEFYNWGMCRDAKYVYSQLHNRRIFVPGEESEDSYSLGYRMGRADMDQLSEWCSMLQGQQYCEIDDFQLVLEGWETGQSDKFTVSNSRKKWYLNEPYDIAALGLRLPIANLINKFQGFQFRSN